jgi:hypothetical protein
MNNWQGYSGPFDSLKEEILDVFEQRAGLSRDMAWLPIIGDVSLSFDSNGFGEYNINSFHEIRGKIEGIDFKISLARREFFKDPGKWPHLRFHSIPRIELPGKILVLFRRYPEYYIYTGEGEISLSKLRDEYIFRPTESCVLGYKPKHEDCRQPDYVHKVKTDLVLHRQENSTIDVNKFPESLTFKEIFTEFEETLRIIIEALKVVPVKTRHLAKAE